MYSLSIIATLADHDFTFDFRFSVTYLLVLMFDADFYNPSWFIYIPKQLIRKNKIVEP